ncbi:hypothetical protein BDV37DRAFT_61238 [Aspergillus pseudonomiae]|uniref:F-box domain-containing protein n=1 Tax=Aspergillus pseudonomiae TaxID=1506151 RepID=A0A5N7CSV5_9EURO|nr:uncharacterized protein BDV37DRAFT_61238 [Aspergillus pseudonomiae]KAE8397276.1 hypothetical protein BDV37DRAFT_61238 [Aspergillus pseudonomiae]
MVARFERNARNPLLVPEIVGLVINNIHNVPDLLNCAGVNSIWNVAALKKLYKGSLNDMQFRTPDIGSLNCLFVASRKQFARNMTFVKHLLLSPEIPASDEVEVPHTRLVCLEKCRAMRHRQYAEYLLQPRGRGLSSLSIPFEIKDQDWSLFPDFLLNPTIEFLAIDSYYCELMLAPKSSSKPRCDLQFFCLEEPSGTEGLTQSDTLELLSCLQQQQNLKVLALNVRHCGPRLGKQGIAWPNMKALYIREGEEDWLDQLPEFEKLQILSLENLGPEIRVIDHSIIENIATCRHLQVLNLHFGEFRDEEELIQIARCCPLLRKFSVRCIDFRADPTLGEDLLLGLLPALPHLEFLALGVKFQMPGALLQDISSHCPRLTVLDLPMTQLCISLAVINELHPLWRLESMHFARIYFENPRHLMQRDKLQSVATEWRRIFPKLRVIPCPGDLYSQSMQEDELGEEIQGDSASLSADEELSSTEPSLDWDDYDSDWFIFRTKLWKVLGYRKDLLIHDKIQYMWQTDLEIEMIRWPIVPLAAFSDPDLHSTTTSCPR